LAKKRRSTRKKRPAPAPPRGQEKEIERALPPGERKRFIWMCVAYALIAVVLSLLLLSDYVFDDLLSGLRHAVASLAASTMSLLGFPVSSRGMVITGPGAALSIANECTGVDATILLVSAILVFPARWLQKLAGVAIAVAVMMVVNFVRVLTLVYLGNYFPEWLSPGHLYVWPIIVIIMGVGTLLVWADRVASSTA
jgi:exosortase/archaeosortase family protein